MCGRLKAQCTANCTDAIGRLTVFIITINENYLLEDKQKYLNGC